MTIWLVLRKDWDWQTIEGVYSREADARAHVARAYKGRELEVEPYVVWEEFSDERFCQNGELRAAVWHELDPVNVR